MLKKLIIKSYANLRNEGVAKTLKKIKTYLKYKYKKILRYPTIFSRYGTGKKRWEKGQEKRELSFWDNPGSHEGLEGHQNFKEKYFFINKNMFEGVRLDFPGCVIVDVGCGPLGGFLPYCSAQYKIGVDPLADEYTKKYKVEKDILMINSMAESIPLLSQTADACYCINTLDHTMKPYKVLEEIFRVLKTGGYFAFSADIGGTKDHPVKLFATDLDNFFAKHPFKILEKKCTTDIKSSWGKNSKIPLYIFQGIKN